MNFEVTPELKELETTHQIRIANFSRKMESLNDDLGKLENAMSALKRLNLIIPDEYYSKLLDYESDIEILKGQMEKEQILLAYLQSSVLRVLEKKPAVSEAAKRLAGEIAMAKNYEAKFEIKSEAKNIPSPAKPVAELALPVEHTGSARPPEFVIWLALIAICLIVIAIAAIFYISQWLQFSS